MTEVLLRVENLHVSVGDTPIIHGISLEIKREKSMPSWAETVLENQRLRTSSWAIPHTKSLVEPSTTRARYQRNGSV